MVIFEAADPKVFAWCSSVIHFVKAFWFISPGRYIPEFRVDVNILRSLVQLTWLSRDRYIWGTWDAWYGVS